MPPAENAIGNMTDSAAITRRPPWRTSVSPSRGVREPVQVSYLVHRNRLEIEAVRLSRGGTDHSNAALK